MANRSYRIYEVVGTSTESVDQAVRNGVDRTAQSIRRLDWFEVVAIRGQIMDGAVQHFQVEMKIGARWEDV